MTCIACFYSRGRQCRRFPPQVVCEGRDRDGFSDTSAYFPWIDLDTDWCGEFKSIREGLQQ